MHTLTITADGPLDSLSTILSLANDCVQVKHASITVLDVPDELVAVKPQVTTPRPRIQKFAVGDRVCVKYNDTSHGVPAHTLGVVRAVNDPVKGSVTVSFGELGIKGMRQSALRLAD